MVRANSSERIWTIFKFNKAGVSILIVAPIEPDLVRVPLELPALDVLLDTSEAIRNDRVSVTINHVLGSHCKTPVLPTASLVRGGVRVNDCSCLAV